jgi:23S rRNA G2445 N2-methylase RlmL
MSRSNLTFFSISNPGLGNISLKEIEELGTASSEPYRSAILFDSEKIINVFRKCQSVKSLALHLCKCKTAEDFSLTDISKIINLNTVFNLPETDTKKLSFNIEVIGVKGNENRIELSGQFYKKIIEEFKDKLNIELSVDYKKYDFIVQIYCTSSEEDNDKNYLVGVKLNDQDFDSREYRVFAHQASFKGDFAYSLLREFEVDKNDKILFVFAKDATLAIEATFFQNNLNVRKVKKDDFVSKSEYFKKFVVNESSDCVSEDINLFTFDERQSNVRAANNNAKLAGVKDKIKFTCSSLDDLDIRYDKEEFSKAIVQLTRKDENRLHEIYHQLSYVLSKGAKIMFIVRPGFDLIIPDNFKEFFNKEITRGGSNYKLICLEKI